MMPAVFLAAVAAAHGHDSDSGSAAERARGLWKDGAGLHLEEDYRGAIERYREALRLQPTARLHTYLAWSLSRLGRYRDAARHCREAIRLDPEYPNAYNDLGSYLIELGEPERAIPWLRRAVSLPDYCCPHYAYYQLGRARLAQARVDAAAEALRQSLILRPRYAPARRLLALIRRSGLRGL